MVQEIKYNGITTIPSDYECPDGDLALCSNLVNEDGRLQPLPQNSEIMRLADGNKVVFIHRTTAFTHYIITNADNTALVWTSNTDTDIADANLLWLAPADVAALNLAAIGNTLVLTATDGLHYFLWKTDGNNQRYLYLGQKPPELQLQFGVSDELNEMYEHPAENNPDEYETRLSLYTTRANGSLDFNEELEDESGNSRKKIKDRSQAAATQTMWAMINKATAEITDKNHFCAPFFVRYCYKMYDGTYILHSAPVFMPLSMPRSLYVMLYGETTTTDGPFFVFSYYPKSVALKYKCLNGNTLASLKNDWGDIVKSVEIFVSLPIMREDNSKNLEYAENANATSEPVRYLDNTLSRSTDNSNNRLVCKIPTIPDNEYLDKIKSVSSFFKIASYDISDTDPDTCLQTGTDNDHLDGFYEVNIRSGILATLATQEAMTDDYKTHNTLVPADGCTPASFIYNRRLNLSGFAERLFDGFCINSMLPCVTPASNYKLRTIAVTLNTEEGEKTVVHRHPGGADFSPLLLINNPLFYPDNRATRMDVYWDANTPGQYRRTVLPLKPCPLLNGAFSQGGIITDLNTEPASVEPASIPSSDNTVNVAFKIYTSETNNPYFFPATGINTVGSGTVLGLAAATKALSEGQFGEFPLYAFTTEGIWALSVNSIGGYSSARPVTRDVCINPQSITPIDNAVLFASSRGIMLLQGATTVCISEAIKDSLPPIPSIPSIVSIPSVIPFSDFINNCRMAYDYTHQRIHLFNPSYNYEYIYSLSSHLWSMADSNLVSVINDYPDTLAMTSDGSLVSLTKPQLNSQFLILNSQFFVTRPLKLGAPNTLKTVITVIQRGMFQRGDVKTILYGSRDLFNWHIIGSSTTHELRNLHGSPYKYFRIVTIATLTPGKSLYGATIDFKPRHTNTLQ